MSQLGETDGYTMEDHIRAIEMHSYKESVDLVVVNQSYVPQAILDNYKKEKSYPVKIKDKEHSYGVMRRLLIQFDDIGRIRHNPDAVAQCVKEILKKMEENNDLRVIF